MIKDNELTIIGHLIKPHGIKGELNAEFDADDINIEDFSCLIFDIDGIYVPFFVESTRPKSRYTRLIKIQNINNEAEANELAGKSIYVLSSEVNDVNESDDDNVYLNDLIGYSVSDSSGEKHLGELIDIDDTTDNVLFIVKNAKDKLLYVPAVEDFILEIKHEDRSLVLDLPDGLISLND